eukprot:8116030-Alexandrium_andersonii.AAC.1
MGIGATILGRRDAAPKVVKLICARSWYGPFVGRRLHGDSVCASTGWARSCTQGGLAIVSRPVRCHCTPHKRGAHRPLQAEHCVPGRGQKHEMPAARGCHPGLGRGCGWRQARAPE